jgi:hypothetical protein
VWYTDANGLEWQQRKLGHRPAYSFQDSNIPGNLYPMTTGKGSTAHTHTHTHTHSRSAPPHMCYTCSSNSKSQLVGVCSQGARQTSSKCNNAILCHASLSSCSCVHAGALLREVGQPLSDQRSLYVSTDRAQGVTSLKDGQLDILVHRCVSYCQSLLAHRCCCRATVTAAHRLSVPVPAAAATKLGASAAAGQH